MDVLRGRISRRAPSKKSPLSLENTEISSLIKQLSTQRPKSTKNTSILSEENILDMDEKLTD
jgi:hypothetical protein